MQKMNKFRINFVCVYFPGGGRDLATAVSIAKKTTFSAPSVFPSTSKSVVASANLANLSAVNRLNHQSQPILKHLIPAESILKPFLPKVNTASTRVHAPSTTTNITAANNAVKSIYTNAQSSVSTSYGEFS